MGAQAINADYSDRNFSFQVLPDFFLPDYGEK
jgi:hypothetical protein